MTLHRFSRHLHPARVLRPPTLFAAKPRIRSPCASKVASRPRGRAGPLRPAAQAPPSLSGGRQRACGKSA